MKITDPESWDKLPFIGNSFLLQRVAREENGVIQPFSETGTAYAITLASALRPSGGAKQIRLKGKTMTAVTTFSSRFAAAATALALSVVLFSNTVTVPTQQFAATTFVGALA